MVGASIIYFPATKSPAWPLSSVLLPNNPSIVQRHVVNIPCSGNAFLCRRQLEQVGVVHVLGHALKQRNGLIPLHGHRDLAELFSDALLQKSPKVQLGPLRLGDWQRCPVTAAAVVG